MHNYIWLRPMMRYYSNRDEDISDTLKATDEHIKRECLGKRPEHKRDCRTYEQMEEERIRNAMKSFDPLIHEAITAMRIDDSGSVEPPVLALEQEVKLPLTEQLVGRSNREFVYVLELFSMVSGIDISHKTVERLYSDELVMMTFYKLHMLILRRESDATGTEVRSQEERRQ